MISPDRLEAAELAEPKQLADMPIDDVLGLLDRPAPAYRDLYYRWESQQWEAGAIDLAEDRRGWLEEVPAPLRRSLGGILAAFYVGVEQATHLLAPFVDAAPLEEQQVFLTTQLVDVARHTIFLDRFLSEVVREGGADMGARLRLEESRLNEASRSLLLESFPDASRRIRKEPGVDALVQGVLLFHVVVEGALALTAQRFVLRHLSSEGLLPALRQGLTAMARDEIRHVAFGVRFLSESLASDERRAPAIRAALDGLTPAIASAFAPSAVDPACFDALMVTPEELGAHAVGALDERSLSIGIDRDPDQGERTVAPRTSP